MTHRRKKRVLQLIKIFLQLLLMTLVIVATLSCSFRKIVINEFSEIIQEGFHVIEKEEDLYLLRQSFPANLKLMETMLVSDPENEQLLLLLSQYYGGFSFLFLETDLVKIEFTGVENEADAFNDMSRSLSLRLGNYYLKGADYALKSLSLRYPDAEKLLNNIKTSDHFLHSLDKKDVPQLFWYAFNLGNYIHHNEGSLKAIAKAHIVEKALKRVIVLEPSYFHGSAHLFLMVFYGSRSELLGGDLLRADAHYKALKALKGPHHSIADLYYAIYPLRQQGDKKTCFQILERIAEKETALNDKPLFDKISAIRAQLYIQGLDRLF